MKTISRIFAVIAMAACVFAACSPEETPTPTPTPTPGGNNGGNNNEGGNNGGTTVELKADFTFAANGMTVQFTNASEGATAYLWNFGDENTSTEKDPEHTYDAAGTYTVKLTVQDASGAAKSVEKDVTVAGAAKAYFSATAITDRSGKYGKIFAFDATSSENAASIAWDFGDGSEGATEFKVNHEFPEYDKTYTVKATVTGLGGDVVEYSDEVTVIGYNELLKGGSMEADDAQYWTIVDKWMMAEDWSGEIVGHSQFVHEFGAANGPAGGKGGALRFGGENQFMQYGLGATIYQSIELAEGDQIELSAQVKWGEETADNGLIRFCIQTPEEFEADQASDASAIVEVFNYWAVGSPLPAYDGDLFGTGLPEGSGWSAPVTEDGKIVWTSTISGEAYFVINLRSVWGNYWGAGKDYWVDEVSAKILL